MLTAAQRPIAMLIRYAVHFVDPEAEVILYGSQARGEADKWSDWDVVVLTKSAVTTAYRDQILDTIYEVELATGEIIMTSVINSQQWSEKTGMAYYKNVVKDGISLSNPQLVEHD